MYKNFHPQEEGFDYCVQRDSAEAFLLIAAKLKLDVSFYAQSMLTITCKTCNHKVKQTDDGILNLPIKKTLEAALEVLDEEINDLIDYDCTNNCCLKRNCSFSKRNSITFGENVFI